MPKKQDTRVWDEITKKIKKIQRGEHVKVGVFGDATKAASHEFGTKTIPKRSFIRFTFEKQEQALAEMTKKVFSKFMDGSLSADQALGLLGEWGAKEVKNTIHKEGYGTWPPLSPGYAMIKPTLGSSKMLVLTGEMINSITYKVGK